MDESFYDIINERRSQRVKSFERLFEKYSRPDPRDDVLDLQTMTIVEDRGHLRSMKPAPFGSKQLASSTIIEKYIEELEEEKTKDSISKASTSHVLRRKGSTSASWCEDDIKKNEASDLCLASWPSDKKSNLQGFKNMLQSFQSCAEHIIGDLFDTRRQDPEIFKNHMKVNFGKKKCSLKKSLSCGNQQWDITLKVSSRDKKPLQDDFYAGSPVEPIFRNVFSTDRNNSFLMNLLHLMRRVPSDFSPIHTTPLKKKSKLPVCHILTMKSKKDIDNADEEMCSVRNFQSRNFKAINYSPMKSTSIHLDASTPSGTNDASYVKEKLGSNQKCHSKNLKAISYSPVKSTLVHLTASTPLSKSDTSYAKEKLGSNQKLLPKNIKAISYSPVKSTSFHFNASTPFDTSDASYANEKLDSNQKSHSKNSKAINYSPVKSTSLHLNASTSLDTSDAKEKLPSSQKRHSKNLKAINYSPVNSTSINLNALTPSRKRCFIADDELCILENKKVCNKKDSNAEKLKTSVIRRKSDIETCITPSVETLNQVPLCDLLKTQDPFPSWRSPKIAAAKTSKKLESNVKDLDERSICILENNPCP